MDKKRNRRPHNSTLNTLFANMLDSYTINWADNTATTKAPNGKVITYKK
jgi:hypothetical protein